MTSNGHDTDHAANPSSVLVVDDEPVIRSLMDSFLTKEGYEVTTADDGQQAVQLMEGVHFDLIITDLMMPVLDGVGVLRASKHADPDRPVIIMTGYPSTESVREMIRLGAADYIVKPFNVDVVQGTVAKILELRQLAAGSEAPTPEDSAAVDSVTGAYDFQTFVDLLETELGRS